MTEATTEQFVGRRVSVKLGNGEHRGATITAINERGIVGSQGVQFDMRPIYGETADVKFDKPYGGAGEVPTMNITFL